MITITAADPDIISQGSVLIFLGEVTHQSLIHFQSNSF